MTHPLATQQIASAEMHIGRVRLQAHVSVSPAGLLAIGGLVAAVLLSIPPIVRAAGQARADAARRRLPPT